MTLTDLFREALEEADNEPNGFTRRMLLNSLVASTHGDADLDAEYAAFQASR